MAAVGLALLVGALPTNEAHADQARDDIASKWSHFRAVAVAQGIGYQYTSTGDALASGARERWGGAMAGSLPYSYAMTSQSRAAGIGSVFWPGFVPSHYKDALPILADTVPVAGLKTPDNVVDGVKTVAGVAPAYPFIASTSGAKASEYTAMPPTQVPGGSVAGVTMRCDPEAASVRCSGSVAKAQLGGGGATGQAFEAALREASARLASRLATTGDKPVSAVTVEGIDTAADAVLTEHEVRSVSTVNIANLDILGAIHLGNIRAAATNIANKTTSEVKRSVVVGEATVAGQSVTIDNQGVTLAGNPAVKQADYEKANAQLREALSASGITIRLFGGAQTKDESGGTDDEGEALYIGMKFAEYGVPDSFFYLNYWVGGTLNTAAGVPVDSPGGESDESQPATDGGAAASQERQANAVESMVTTPTMSFLTPVEFGPSFTYPATSAPSFASSSSESAASPMVDTGANQEQDASGVVAVQTVQPIRETGGPARSSRAVVVGLLGLWQVFGLAVIAAVGRARVLARRGA